MTNGISLFNKLELDDPFKVGLYISGIIFILSFITSPIGIEINIVRAKSLRILFISLIALIVYKIIQEVYNYIHPATPKLTIGGYLAKYALAIIYITVVMFTLKI